MLGITTLDDYLRLDITDLANQFTGRPHEEWSHVGETQALRLFQAASRRVPAYRDFLANQGCDADGVHTIEDFRAVPPTDKTNYIDRYPLERLVWDGDVARSALMNTSSGTGGRTYLWPTAPHEIGETATIYEYVCRYSLGIHKVTTLFVVCFGMGTWIAGGHTLAATQQFHRKGYRITIVTPGFDKVEALKVLRALAAKFDQVVIAGIPSFVKDLLQQWVGERDETQPIKLLLAGEGFSEDWRDFMVGQLTAASSSECVTSILGSADAGIMGFETAATIALRQSANIDLQLRHSLFANERLPMLFNYLPEHRFFEEQNGELLVTANRAIPLIRYNMHDEGRLLSHATVNHVINENGGSNRLLNLPIVAVFGRGKFAATLYGVVIHAEQVQSVLLHSSVAAYLTGRFALETAYTAEQDQCLELHVELACGQPPNSDLGGRLVQVFVDAMRNSSSEYSRLYSEYGTSVDPIVCLHPYGDPQRFPHDRHRKVT